MLLSAKITAIHAKGKMGWTVGYAKSDFIPIRQYPVPALYNASMALIIRVIYVF